MQCQAIKKSKENRGMLIKGDNMDVLKDLLPLYEKQVQCIYIDPPYNTGKVFYGFKDNLDEQKWLDNIKIRLSLLWDFLKENGTLWISIDDYEYCSLKVLCDSLFGRDCLVSTIVREKNDAPRNKKHRISHMHDYILVYSPSPEQCKLNDVTFESSERYSVTSDTGQQWIYEDVEACGYRKTEYDCYGNTNKETRKRYKEKTPFLPPTTLWLKDEVGTNQEARKEFGNLFHNEFFYVSKPERLLKKIIEIATDKNDIVLDAYLGSGTTAAVAHKLCRKWIGIEIGEECIEYCYQRMKFVTAGEQEGISKSVEWHGGADFIYIQDMSNCDMNEINILLRE